ncbi:calcipressin-3 isoform X2 [Ictalurus punctatus]|uniref:Calcipressin-3 isoform X2 n=1 Tax=Ictalurus punctatus TaxID=7998 RepID=A0A9F7R977_ICTPU|nr:calcipressin-3 isoform X2 [Ictalurus punctatus]
MQMMRDGLKLWSNGSDAHNSDPEEDEDEEEMLFGENDDESEDMMDLSDLPTSLFACSVHDAVFEEDRQRPNDGLLHLHRHLFGPHIESSHEQLLNANSTLGINQTFYLLHWSFVK